MIFCDYSRIATEPVNGYWHDTRSDTLLNNDAYIRCTPGITGKLVFGWTGQYDYKPDQIQLCPWFLTFMWRQKFSQSDQVDPSWLVHIPQEAMDAMNAVHSTPIDGFALLEKLLLHELTHTTVAGRSEDLVSKSLPDYGWLYCLDVATPHGSANAENLAYAGVGASLIVKKLKLNKNGGFDL